MARCESERVETWIALLRGVNVGGRNHLPMADLRARCAEAGLLVRTHIQSGNLVFRSARAKESLESDLERVLHADFGLDVPVVVVAAMRLAEWLQEMPFDAPPASIHVVVAKGPLGANVAAAVEEKGAAGERAVVVDGVVWIHYPAGAGRSKVTPAVLDRTAGMPVTARNLNTVRALAALV